MPHAWELSHARTIRPLPHALPRRPPERSRRTAWTQPDKRHFARLFAARAQRSPRASNIRRSDHGHQSMWPATGFSPTSTSGKISLLSPRGQPDRRLPPTTIFVSLCGSQIGGRLGQHLTDTSGPRTKSDALAGHDRPDRLVIRDQAADFGSLFRSSEPTDAPPGEFNHGHSFVTPATRTAFPTAT